VGRYGEKGAGAPGRAAEEWWELLDQVQLDTEWGLLAAGLFCVVVVAATFIAKFAYQT